MKTKFIITLIVMLIVSVMVTAAMAQETRGKHKENNITCMDCHKTENPDSPADVSACAECHGEMEDVAKLTEQLKINPHKSHLVDIDCTECHKIHEPSVLYCNQCHDYKMIVK